MIFIINCNMNLILDPGSWQSFQHRHAKSDMPILEMKRMYLAEQAKFHEQFMMSQAAAEMAQGNGGGQSIGVIGPVDTTTTTTTSTTTTTTTEEPTTTTTSTTTTTTTVE